MIATPVFHIEGIPNAVQVLRRRMLRLENFSDPLRILAGDFYRVQQAWMDTEGHGRWPQLNPRYAAWKRRKVGDKPILQFRGDMYDDLTGRGGEGGLRISPTRVTIRAAKTGRRWVYHTEGLATGNASGRARPRRQVLSPALRIRKKYWTSLMVRWINGEDVR